jgi:hypothetical protein
MVLRSGYFLVSLVWKTRAKVNKKEKCDPFESEAQKQSWETRY